ncbi:hypothetical protein ACMGD3_23890 [Lysinibacillus sphaericus]|uniref:DNA-binding protein n=1 Tax=Lysinibacillus sphaericus TaxID=1421 RepID=UPI003F7AD93C
MDDKKNVLDYIIDTKEASELWGLSVQRIKQLATNGDINAKKIGSSWAIDKTQKNPKQYKKEEN